MYNSMYHASTFWSLGFWVFNNNFIDIYFIWRNHLTTNTLGGSFSCSNPHISSSLGITIVGVSNTPCGVLLFRRFSGWPCCKWWMTSTWGPNYWNQWNWYDMCKSWAGYIFSSSIISPFNKLNITCQNAFAFYLVSFKSPNETLIY